MAVCYSTKSEGGKFVATIFKGQTPERGSTVWSIEEGREIPCSAIRAQVALADLGTTGPIFADQPTHHPSSFDDVGALCRWVIRSGGRVEIATVR